MQNQSWSIIRNIQHEFKIFKLIILFILFSLNHSLKAENLLELYLIARDNDPNFINTKLAVLQKLEETKIAKALFLPKIQANANTGYNLNKDHNFNHNYSFNHRNYGINLTQKLMKLPDYFEYKKVKTEFLSTLKKYDLAEQSLILKVADQYFAILVATDQLNATTAEYQNISSKLKQTKQKLAIGIASRTDVLEAQARLDHAYAKQIADTNALSIEKEKLNEIMGKYINNVIPLKLETKLNEPIPKELTLWLEVAKKHNLQIQKTNYDLDTAKEQINQSYTAHYPSLNLNLDLMRLKNYPSKNTNSFNKQIGLQLSIPIFEGGATTAKTNLALLNKTIAWQQLQLNYRQTETNTVIAFNNIITSLNKITAFEQLKSSNQAAFEATQLAFQAGTRTILDLFDAHINLLNSQKEYNKAKYEYIINALRLKQAIGTLKIEDLQEINNLLATNPNIGEYTITNKT